MTEQIDPRVAAVLHQAELLQAVMDTQLRKVNTETFSATDDTGTVKVTLNAEQQMVDVHIENGLLRRLGAATIQQRLNHALRNASATATAATLADQQRLDTILTLLPTTCPSPN